MNKGPGDSRILFFKSESLLFVVHFGPKRCLYILWWPCLPEDVTRSSARNSIVNKMFIIIQTIHEQILKPRGTFVFLVAIFQMKEFHAQSFNKRISGLYSVDFSSSVPYNTLNDYIEVFCRTEKHFVDVLVKIIHPSKGLSLVEWSWGSWEQILVKNWKQHPWVGLWRGLLQNGEDF